MLNVRRHPSTLRADIRLVWIYLTRALQLRCPECGIWPVFVPWWRTRSLDDWFTPLDGCPRCGYAYRREDGYFLLATWGIHYFTVTGLALAIALLVDWLWKVDLWVLIVAVWVPTLLFGFLFARHAKSIYMAIDHFFDSHVTLPPDSPAHDDSDRRD